MNELIIRGYESDLDLFLSYASQDQINKAKAKQPYEEGLFTGCVIIARIAADQILFRLGMAGVEKYRFFSLKRRERYIQLRINQLSKEKINAQPKT